MSSSEERQDEPSRAAASRTRDRSDDPLSMRQLEVFVALADQGSFTKAARRLGLSQPTVSGHMADLESRLGIRLVERVRSGVRPTSEGEVLLRPAREALRGEQNVRAAAAELHGLVSGTLVVGASTIPSVYILPALLAKFRRVHPSVRIRLETGSSSDILESISAGTVEIGVVGTAATQRGMRSTVLQDDRLVLITAPDHDFATRASVERDAVLAETLILRPPGSGTRDAMLTGLGLRHADRELDATLQVDGTDGVKAAVRAGLGVSFVSELAVRDELAHELLATCDVAGFQSDRQFHVATRSEAVLSPAVRAFRDMMTS